MLIEIKEEVFQKHNLQQLSKFLGIVFDSITNTSLTKAKLYVDSDVFDSDILSELSSTDRELIEDSFLNSAYDNNEIDYIVCDNNIPKNHFKLAEAIVFLEAPLHIILENGENDALFIQSIMQHFDDEQQLTINFLNKRWIDFTHAGGGTAVKSVIKSKLRSFNSISLTHGSCQEKFFRALVILDSDKSHKNDIVSKYDLIITFLKAHNIDYHVLEKRSMENYMPIEVIRDIKRIKQSSTDKLRANCIAWIDFYEYLNEEQRDYVDFSGYKLLTPEIETLFINQIGKNLTILKDGIQYKNREDDTLDENEKKFKNSFPLFFENSPFVNQRTLKNRANSEELELILEKIKRRL